MKKKKKIKWASSVAIGALKPYVREVLASIAHRTGKPGIARAFVSDMSSVSDFLDSEDTGETEPHPFDKSKTVKLVTAITTENHAILKKVSEDLGVLVGVYDDIYEIAIRVRDRESY